MDHSSTPVASVEAAADGRTVRWQKTMARTLVRSLVILVKTAGIAGFAFITFEWLFFFVPWANRRPDVAPYVAFYLTCILIAFASACGVVILTNVGSGRSNASESPGVHSPKRVSNALVGVKIGLLLNTCAVGLELTLFFSTPGSAIRPMGLACWSLVLAATSLLVGIPISIKGLFSERGWQRWLGISGVLLNLAIFPAGGITMRLVAAVMNLTFEP
jgi:hypothetical protein